MAAVRVLSPFLNMVFVDSGGDRCAWEENGKKAEPEVDGQYFS